MIDEERIINQAWFSFKDRIKDFDVDAEINDIIYLVYKSAYRTGYAKGHADSTTIRSKDCDQNNTLN